MKRYKIYITDPKSGDICKFDSYQALNLESLVDDIALMFTQVFPYALGCNIEVEEIE